MFAAVGERLGFSVRRTWAQNRPTDGVWVIESKGAVRPLPVVALEVIVSEGLKSARGSVQTLAAVSPALGVLLLQEEEIARRLMRRGLSRSGAEYRVAQQRDALGVELGTQRQRLEIWSFEYLRRVYATATLRETIYSAVQSANY
ncbi:MAG: hypothetical protein QOK05_509 [Chloroflexota bacterium]|jgi:hypothetical protein|nr:hypothetical protein [Chloroflexota bacterium]